MRRHYITERHPDAEGVWTLCDLETGRISQTFGSGDRGHASAVRALSGTSQFRSLVAAAGELPRWVSDPAIAFEGTPTSDRRQMDDGSVRFRPFPLPVMLQTTTAWGHDGAIIAGRMDEASVDSGNVVASGVLDDGPGGVEYARLLANGMMRGVSVDLGEIDVITEVLETDEDGWPTDWLDHFTVAEVMGVTGTPFPAFAEAAIRLEGAPPAAVEEEVDVEVEVDAAEAAEVVVAAGGPGQPALENFHEPAFIGPEAQVVHDVGADGWRRITGFLAVWGTCHVGRQGACVTPPPSASQYAYFATGYVECETGCHVPIGVLTLGGGHASINDDASEARRHYDETGYQAAYIAVGENEWGIWYSGVVRQDLTEDQLTELRASAPSGDWRLIDGSLELVAALAVNVPGFPVPRARVASGEQVALVAAVTPRPRDNTGQPAWARALRSDVDNLKRQLRSLRGQVISNLDERMH